MTNSCLTRAQSCVSLIQSKPFSEAQWSCTDLINSSYLTKPPEISLLGFSFETGQWKDASPALIVPGEEKFSVDELKSNGQTLPEK